jgi:uncharacterized protein YfaQ (DUF2300 family)
MSAESKWSEKSRRVSRMRAMIVAAVFAISIALASSVSWSAPAKQCDSPCESDEAARSWLSLRTGKWDRNLSDMEGYERPEGVSVCLVQSGRPHVDYACNRIFLRRIEKGEDTLTLVHEYLHLAFKNHPRAKDEVFIENLARTLLLDGER